MSYRGGVLHGRIEPKLIVSGRQDDRHPVVQGLHQLVGLGGDDRTRLDRLGPLAGPPALPEAGQAQWPLVFEADEIWLLLAAGLLPFVKSVGRHQAPSAAKRRAKGGL